MPQRTIQDESGRAGSGAQARRSGASGAVWGISVPVVIAGPCAVESASQMEGVAARLSEMGVRVLRGGAFKARTAADSFQGLREEGVEILALAGRKHGMLTISEALDARHVEFLAERVDILQVGSRNMYNYELLKELARTGKPVFLKRSFMATLDEFTRAAEYLLKGKGAVALCERGIRTFEAATRNTLDIMAVPIMKERLGLPVFVDVSHSTGRSALVLPAARAAMAVGADGIMVEVHPDPPSALSDRDQQISIEQFSGLLEVL
jgi:3-deoxy-7-phosphoheptulonate synthase/chorismate mutase